MLKIHNKIKRNIYIKFLLNNSDENWRRQRQTNWKYRREITAPQDFTK
jgi:hypothetical protein